MCFNKNVRVSTKDLIKAMWGGEIVSETSKYLGLTQLVGKEKNKTFLELKQKVMKKLQRWKEKLLSQGGK